MKASLVLGSCCLLYACGGTSDDDATEGPAPNSVIIHVALQDGTWYGFAQYSEPTSPACDYEVFGDCTVDRSCDVDPSWMPGRTFDAGTVTIQGTMLPLDPVGLYYNAALPAGFQEGDIVDMAATGSVDVPPHSGSVEIPEAITVLEPALDTIVTVERSQDLEVAWTPVAVGGISVNLTVLDGLLHTTVSCCAEASAGHFSVPSTAFQRLPPTSETITGSLGVGQGNSRLLRPQGWEIFLSVPGFGGDGADAEVR